MKQTDLVLDYMKKNGSITPRDAWDKLGVYRLAAVIFILKEKGIKITSIRETGVNKFDTETRYSRYFLGV
jgi:hypothetical protein